MTSIEKSLTIVTAILAILFFGLAVALCAMSYENRKLNTVLDMSCDFSLDKATCRKGIDLVRNMSLKELQEIKTSLSR